MTSCAHLGATITAERLRILSLLADPLAQSYQAVAPGSAPGGGYAISWWDASALATVSTTPDLNDLRDALLYRHGLREREELDRGDDTGRTATRRPSLHLGDLPVKGYASTGVLVSGTGPAAGLLPDPGGRSGERRRSVLLLDDVFAELDEQRRLRLAELVEPAEQVLVTAAVAADVPAASRKDPLGCAER